MIQNLFLTSLILYQITNKGFKPRVLGLIYWNVWTGNIFPECKLFRIKVSSKCIKCFHNSCYNTYHLICVVCVTASLESQRLEINYRALDFNDRVMLFKGSRSPVRPWCFTSHELLEGVGHQGALFVWKDRLATSRPQMHHCLSWSNLAQLWYYQPKRHNQNTSSPISNLKIQNNYK